MKALAYNEPHDVSIKNVPQKIEKPTDMLVSTNVCNSKLHMYEGWFEVKQVEQKE